MKLDRTFRNLQQYLTKSDVKRNLVSVLIHATCGMLGMISGITLTVSLMCLTMQSGLTSLKAVHLNDSLYGRGSRKDRHTKLGKGTIGLEAMERIVKHPALAGKPFILETPCNLTEYQQEIAVVNSWLGEA